MGIIQWDSKYEVNVKKIDRQHRKIVNILNKLYDRQETIAKGNRLQKEEHNAFIEKICSFQQDYFKEKPLAVINLFNFVWDWFAHHILTFDKKCMAKEGSAR